MEAPSRSLASKMAETHCGAVALFVAEEEVGKDAGGQDGHERDGDDNRAHKLGYL